MNWNPGYLRTKEVQLDLEGLDIESDLHILRSWESTCLILKMMHGARRVPNLAPPRSKTQSMKRCGEQLQKGRIHCLRSDPQSCR